MVLKPVIRPYCGSENVFLHGHDKKGKQRYRCDNPACKHKTFVEYFTYNGCDHNIRAQVLILTVNGNGTRAISRSLKISQNTVTSILRSVEQDLWYVNYTYIEQHQGINVDLVRVEESEMDEMGAIFMTNLIRFGSGGRLTMIPVMFWH